MKTLLSILVFTAAITQSIFAQTTTLTFPTASAGPVRQQNIQVLAGEVFELLTYAPGDLGNGIAVSVGGVPVPLRLQIYADNPYVPYTPPFLSGKFIVAGPLTVSFAVASTSSLVCTYKMTALTATATVNVASQAVVIPADAAAPVDIILESSTDLITWTAAVAGSYAPSTSKRFFRVRAVAH